MSSFEENVENLLGLVKRRWQKGIDRFNESFEAGFAMWVERGKPRAPTKVIRTALYGDVTFSEPEALFLDSFYLQRLRNISQMGLLHYVYPDARHSRFEHSVGVFWMMKELALQKDWEALGQKKLGALIYAALLHDIGHGPLSHTAEQVLDLLGLAKKMRAVKTSAVRPKYHEVKSGEMILDSDQQLIALGRSSYAIRGALEKLDIDPNRVVGNIWGDPNDPVSALINGPLDVDKMDYYQRDSFHTGVLAGGIDVEYMMRVLRFNPVKSPFPFFEEKAFGPVLQMILNREFVYSSTAFHPVVRLVQAMFLVALEAATSLLNPKEFNEVVFALDMMDEGDIWSLVDIIIAFSNDCHDRAILEDLAERLRSRTLYKRLATLTAEDCRRCSLDSDEEIVDHNLTPLRYVTRQDVKGSSLLQRLEIRDNEVLIFEAYPVPDRKKAGDPFHSVHVESRGSVASLFEKLGPNAGTLVDSYGVTREQLFRALVISPEHVKERFNSLAEAERDKTLKELGEVLREKGQPDVKSLADDRFQAFASKLREIADRKRTLGMPAWAPSTAS